MTDINTLYYDFSETLLDVFREYKTLQGYEVSILNDEKNIIITNGEECINFIVVNEFEIIFYYKNAEGIICFNTNSHDKTFVKTNGNVYFGLNTLNEEPVTFINECMSGIRNSLNASKTKTYHN